MTSFPTSAPGAPKAGRRSAPFRGPLPAVLLLVLALCPSAGSARQQPAPTTGVVECPAPCSGPLTCRICTLKLEAYREWMEVVDAGVERFPLSPSLVERLSPHFPLLDLEVVEVGATRKQVADGLTDCTRVYLADPRTVAELREGELPSGPFLELFLHELVHVEQCLRMGGRDAYALTWFRDLGVGAMALLQGGQGWNDLHAAMPMESQAAARAAVLVHEVEAQAEAREP